MPIKVANIRLGARRIRGTACRRRSPAQLGLPRDAIVHWRILRKSLDARGHDDIHFSYAAVVDLPEHDLARIGAVAGIRDVRSRPFRLAGAGLEPARGTGRSSSAPGPAGLFAGYLLAQRRLSAARSWNAAGPSRTGSPTSAASMSRARSIPRATTSSAREAPAPSATASSPRAAPAPT